MKIKELRLKNLNSLYGEWRIDFTAPEYALNGIFALTGPTGAGKSTILDALCLALYGRTPRLAKINKTTNEIMSRQTWECSAEVVFESKAGTFRCQWVQRRAHKSPEGNLQDQRHEIYDGITGQPIETMKSKTVGVIEEKTGMDYHRFTRSILLAQGDFDVFLKAGDEDKSRILEQITGTEIYSEISQAVHSRQREEREALNLLMAQTSGFEILSQEEEESLVVQQGQIQTQEKDLTQKLNLTREALGWLKTIEALTEELQNLDGEEALLKEERESFEPKRKALEAAQKAADLEPLYATLSSTRQAQKEDTGAIQSLDITLPEVENSGAQIKESLSLASREAAEARAALESQLPVLQQVRTLDLEITQQSQRILEESRRAREINSQIEIYQRDRSSQEQVLLRIKEGLSQVDKYLEDHKGEEALVSGLGSLEERHSLLEDQSRELEQKEEEEKEILAKRNEASGKLQKSQEAIQKAKEELDQIQKGVDQSQETLTAILDGRLLREHKGEKDSLVKERYYLRRIESLEEQRAELKEGEPCPLCGSLDHPYVLENTPSVDELDRAIKAKEELITQAEEAQDKLQKQEAALQSARERVSQAQMEEKWANQQLVQADKALADHKALVQDFRKRLQDNSQILEDKLISLGGPSTEGVPLSQRLSSLHKLREAWLQSTQEKVRLEKDLVTLQGDIKGLINLIAQQQSQLQEQDKELESLHQIRTDKQNQRSKILGDLDPQQEETRLKALVTQKEGEEKKWQEKFSENQQKLVALKSRRDSLAEKISQREPQLKQIEAKFQDALKGQGFSTEAEFLTGQMPLQERASLVQLANSFASRQGDLEARKKDRKARLTREENRRVTEESKEALDTLGQEQEASLQRLRQEGAGIQHRLQENATARERFGAHQRAIESQRRECDRWDRLHSLIGSADGKRYRNFAQGLTFEIMVSHANQQLAKMTDRYLLVRDEDQPLELNVVDNYQAGETRSTRNLSGGEGFLISLALALGLSQMASRQVRVDSLFLDEGFGTLDEDALETALETLASLHQEGKLIGVISHVTALKERISTQIAVHPLSGGRSGLSGPGCSKLYQNTNQEML